MPPQTELKNDFRKLGLDIRVVNALAAQGIFALADLAQITDREFASFRGVGPNTRKLLQDYLKKETPEAVHPDAISLNLPSEFVRIIDEWSVNERVTSRSEAIRRLVEMALAAQENS
ncbi:MAG TPA: DNA-directed RNA polymerase subunit alpha C-terminal domain-containing protein [Rhizomicrobium sp.]|nr:DNA-directed RNA polymerase subunit alpha C-terminal domain-containing protein [Rhizomicrobium sp.]